MDLKKGVIRGEESNGMLCSEREMGLSDDHEGIIDLPEDAPVGEPFAKLMGLDDPVIDIAITPNRGDCLGVYGVARDLAAAGIGTLKLFPAAKKIEGAFESGATEVLVADGHGTMRNILLDDLDPRARLPTGPAQPVTPWSLPAHWLSA